MWASFFHKEHGSKQVFILASSCRNFINRPLMSRPLLQLQQILMRPHNNHMESGNSYYVCQSGFNSQWGEESKILSFQNSGQKYHFSSFDHGESTHIGLSSFLFIWRIFCQKIWSWNNVQRIGVHPRWNNWKLKFFPSYSSPTGCLTVIGPVKPLKLKLKFLWEWLFVCIVLGLSLIFLLFPICFHLQLW